MKKLNVDIKKLIQEAITLPIEIGDTVLMGKFKNRKVVVKTISFNEKGDLLINDRTAMKMRLVKKQAPVEETIKLTEETIELPADKTIVLQAGTDDHKRGLVVTWLSEGGYDVAYWYGTPDNIVAAELKGDGKSFGDIKKIWLGYHPKIDEGIVNEEDYKYKKQVAKAFKTINDAMFDFRHSMGLKQLTNKDMKLKKKVESLHAAIFDLQKEMRKDGLSEIKKGESGCCHKCGHSHPKGGTHPTPYKTGKNSCASKTSESIKEDCGCGCSITEYDVESAQDIREFQEFMTSNYIAESTIQEAEYEGRKVKLGKPMQGDVKKFKVYVKNAKGNTVKVNFGQKGMVIKKDNPGAKKSFRARHNCDSPGPRDKARYWSCRKW